MYLFVHNKLMLENTIILTINLVIFCVVFYLDKVSLVFLKLTVF